MTTDLTFITNESGKNLKDRFNTLVKDTQFFDILVGYFYTSGFYAIYPQLEKTEKIRILIGISTNKQTYDLLQRSKSHKEINEEVGNKVKSEMDDCENNYLVEEGIYKFLEWLKSGKLEIKAYPEEKIHSKLYIMTFKKDELNKFNDEEKEYLKMLHTNTGRFFTPDTDKYIFYISKKNFNNKNIDNYPNIKINY